MRQVSYVYIDTFEHDSLHFSFFKFSGGEWHVKLKTKFDVNDIVVFQSRIDSMDELMKLLLLKDALELRGHRRFELIMPYIPYARQDRKCAEGESFSLKVFTNILNAANFEKVTVLDAHSDVAPALIKNCENISNKNYVESALHSILDMSGKPYLISPDSGANKKMNKLYSELTNMTLGLVKCDKVRDVKTGQLSGFEVFYPNLHGMPCLIVDDICDGGGTFLGLAEELKRKNAGDLYLFVTHGIFSRGLEELGKHFKKIYCTDSIGTAPHPLVRKYHIFV